MVPLLFAAHRCAADPRGVDPVIDAARDYRQRGLSVIPVGPDKKPLVKWDAFQDEPPHADQVDEWWTRWPEANVGIITGSPPAHNTGSR